MLEHVKEEIMEIEEMDNHTLNIQSKDHEALSNTLLGKRYYRFQGAFLHCESQNLASKILNYGFCANLHTLVGKLVRLVHRLLCEGKGVGRKFTRSPTGMTGPVLGQTIGI